MRLVHFADLHLDTAFRWATPQAARKRRQALRDTLHQIIALADEVDADAIVCAGDLYEHDRFTPDTTAFVRDAFTDTDCQVVIAPGNHDWFGPGSLYVQANWAPNVHLFKEDRLTPFELEDGLTLWGAAHRKPAGTDGFLDSGFRVPSSGINLAVFHGSERLDFRFQEEGKEPHAPFDAQQLEQAGIDHALLGHFHQPTKALRHTYPGNPDPLSFGEQGERGAVIIDVNSDGTVEREWRTVAVSETHDINLDITGCQSGHAVRERARERLADLGGSVRMTVQGGLAPDVELVPDDLNDIAPHLDALVVRRGDLHVAYDLNTIADENTVRGQFVADVLAAPNLDDEERERTIVIGLRALDGRNDLEVV